jgi:pimeloyl-ACP methyl ester carboxylesterase
LKTAGGNTGQLTRPIIIVEGIDFFEQFPTLATTEIKVLDLLNTNESHNLSNRLREEGFDVVILNWGNSGDFLQKNAFLVVRLIEEINRLKVGNEPNVLVGVSMGGLVSRYALTWMEQNGRTHNVRQFISYDSPQAGANFPLGLQFWAQSFGAFNTSVLNVAELAGVRSFNSESSKQMLKFHLTGVTSVNGRNVVGPISNHTNFFNEIEGLNSNFGYPLNCQNIAISNGAKRGIGFLNSGVAFGYDLGTATSGFVSDLPTTPPSDPSGLFGQFSPAGRFGFNLVPVSPEQDYDNAPGGFVNWYSAIATVMNNQGFSASVRPN